MTAPFCPNCGAQAAPDQSFCTSCGAPLTQPIPSPEAGGSEAMQSTATAAIAGRGCPYCRLPLKEGGAIIECGACHAVHHDDCYSENGGCAVAGCADGPTSQYSATLTRVMPTTDEVTARPTPAPAARIPDRRHKPATMIAIAASMLALVVCGVVAALLIAGNSNATPSAATVTETLSTATATNAAPTTDTNGATTTPPATPAPTVSTAAASTVLPLTAYTGVRFSAQLPAGWNNEEDESNEGSYVESKWRNPSDPSDSILVDVSPASNVSSDQMAAPVHAALQSETGYQEISYGPGDLSGGDSWKWVFRIAGVERIDYFFSQCTRDFAVLGSTTPNRFKQLLPAFKAVAESVQATCG